MKESVYSLCSGPWRGWRQRGGQKQGGEAVLRYDIAIVGTGPAGISAALTAKSRNKSILLIGSEKGSEKIAKTHMIVNYPGLPDVTGPELNRRLLDQVKAAGIPITEKRVAGIYAMGDYFSLQADQDFLEASSVILTTGTSFGKPLPGENENLGRGVSYCATCDAPLYKGKEVIVVGWNPKEESEAIGTSTVGKAGVGREGRQKDAASADRLSLQTRGRFSQSRRREQAAGRSASGSSGGGLHLSSPGECRAGQAGAGAGAFRQPCEG